MSKYIRANMIHSTAYIHQAADVDENSSIGRGAYIGRSASVAEGASIGKGATIDDGATILDGAIIDDGATVRSGAFFDGIGLVVQVYLYEMKPCRWDDNFSPAGFQCSISPVVAEFWRGVRRNCGEQDFSVRVREKFMPFINLIVWRYGRRGCQRVAGLCCIVTLVRTWHI